MRIHKQTIVLLTSICFFQFHVAIAQTEPDIFDFAKNKEFAIAELKKHAGQDTNRVNALIKVFSTATYLKERQEVLPYQIEAMRISRRLSYVKGLAYCYFTAGNYYKSSSNYAEALHQYDTTLLITAVTKDRKLLDLRSSTCRQIGLIYYEQGNYYSALDHFFESLRYEENNSLNHTINLHSFITRIYLALNNLEKATEFAKRNISLVENDSSWTKQANVYFTYIDICLEKKDLQNASTWLDKIAPNIPHQKQVQINFGYYLKKGHILYQQEDYRNAYIYYQQAFMYAVMGGHKISRSAALRFLSATALKLGDQEAAKKYALDNLALAEEINTRKEKIEALKNLSNYYNATGDKDKAIDLLQKAMNLKDSIMAETNNKQINILGAIYEADKQNREIDRLQQEKAKQAADARNKAILNRIFIASILVMLIVGWLGLNNFKKGQRLAKNQQELQKQKIIELEKDRQLLTVDAMLKGQEEERSRIAKDLHDGLGSMLSGTKLSFMNVKDNLDLSPVNSMMFDKSLSMLDNSIIDLRKVAQNLMPEALVKFGLSEALEDFCESIQSTTSLKIVYQYFGEPRRLDNTAEVFIYRIVQELVNNVIKHADANEVIVQLAMNSHKIGITVEDDGKGFDPTILRKAKGAGMANIRYRMQYFNGRADIVTAPGKGTSVNIELMI